LAGPPFAAVLRISDVAVAQRDLEIALGVTVDRYEPARAGSLHYGQINFTKGSEGRFQEEDVWAGIIDGIDQLGPQLQTLRRNRRIGRISLDLAVSFAADLAVATYDLPSRVAEVVGRHGIDLEFSVYLASGDDEP
jgi:hypothetical protein